nr:DEAD/DEAH box helicase [Chloroflexota bacterium]
MASARVTLDRLRLDRQFMSNVAAWEALPPRPSRHAPLPPGLYAPLGAALRRRGIEQLYTHQASAVAAALRGENVAIVSGTASGKTLCYNLPVLHTLLQHPSARALYLFPTKALAQDQAAELADFIAALDSPTDDSFRTPHSALRIGRYDGDTPQAHRAAIRRDSSIVISNPDMLHAGILPHHTRWSELFANLRWIVLDELHTYRGVFGSHVANVLRRLRRLCNFYGSDPRFICASATIANP